MGSSTQQWQGKRVVATDGKQRRPVGGELERVTFDRGDGFINVEGIDRHIAGIRDLHLGKRRGTRRRIIGTQ